MRIRHLRIFLLLSALLTATAIAGCGSAKSSSTGANAADRAFVQQMIPHHMMAIQMAQTAEQHAGHAQIKTLATGIISAQKHEIAEMTPIAKSLGVTPGAMPTGGQMSAQMSSDAKTLGLTMTQMGMSMKMSTLASMRPFDRAFIDMMIPHHQGAVRMAQAELAHGTNSKLRTIATKIIAAQAHEIREMNQWRTQWYGARSPAGGVPTA